MNIRFAVASDLHIALPETIHDSPNRFHLTQFSISALETVLNHLETLDIDFLLLPGDLTQDGEKLNHQWLQTKLNSLPYPVYVVPGNHDIPSLTGDDYKISYPDFPHYYQNCGYQNPAQFDYSCEIAPNLQLIALNSTNFDTEGKQLGCLTENQFLWLETTLSQLSANQRVLLMIHHNVIEHLPQQSQHILGKRYMLDNASRLLSILEKYRVQLIFTGHLHIQDIAQYHNIYEITTGSLITYPHPYRILELTNHSLTITSHRLNTLPHHSYFTDFSRQWMCDRSFSFMMTILTSPPLNLSRETAMEYAPILRDFWVNIAEGDHLFHFPQLPPEINQYFQQFGAIDQEGNALLRDNHTILNFT